MSTHPASHGLSHGGVTPAPLSQQDVLDLIAANAGGGGGGGLTLTGDTADLLANYEQGVFTLTGNTWVYTSLSFNTGLLVPAAGGVKITKSGLFNVVVRLTAQNLTDVSGALTAAVQFGGLPVTPNVEWDSSDTAIVDAASFGSPGLIPTKGPASFTVAAAVDQALTVVNAGHSGFAADTLQLLVTLYPLLVQD